MAFTKNPAGAPTNYTLVGTDGIDITTIAGSNGPVTVSALGNSDQVTIQSTDGVAFGFDISMGEGNDRVFTDATPNGNNGQFIFVNSTIRGNEGDDIIFADEAGLTNPARTNYLQYSFVNGNQGRDIIRTYGLLSSRIDAGKDEDKIELTNIFIGNDNVFPADPDRYDDALVQGNFGADTIEIKIGRTNFVNSLINGNADNDLITNFGTHDLSGNWLNSTIRGGQGNDIVDLQTSTVGFVSSSLLVYGDKDNDTLLTGVGNDTVIGGVGADVLNVAGGVNVLYGDNTDGSGNGADAIFVNLAQNATNYNNQNTVYAGEGTDSVLLYSNGNNVVYGDASTATGASDTIRIFGNGNNSVLACAGNDTVAIVGGGSNTVFGAAGSDTIRITDGRDVSLFGEDGNDFIISENMTGAASINGAAGSDVILVSGAPTSGVFDAGTSADQVDIIPDLARATYVQEDGDSVDATAITNLNGEFFQAGSVIAFADGVDVITNFQEDNILDTTLGTIGLDATANANAGGLYDGNLLSAQNGFVAGRSYYLRGTFVRGVSFDGTFTLDNAGDDALVLTQGNNGPLTGNANSVILEDFGANVAALDSSNFV